MSCRGNGPEWQLTLRGDRAEKDRPRLVILLRIKCPIELGHSQSVLPNQEQPSKHSPEGTRRFLVVASSCAEKQLDGTRTGDIISSILFGVVEN
jgi:hypothetical protein